MKLLRPSDLPQPLATGESFLGLSPPSNFSLSFHGAVNSHVPETMEEYGGKIHVAVGKSVEKAVNLLRWTFNCFKNKEICILHVYQPSSVIPTLLGKLPANQANPEYVSAFRREEREKTRRLLENYLRVCLAAKVKASIIIVQADQVQKGIVDLVVKHGIRKLVIGAVPENCKKVKRSSRKANYAAKNAPPFCEVWFIHKGKHVWTREASENPCFLPSCSQPEILDAESLISRSFQYGKNDMFRSEHLEPSSERTSICTGIGSWVRGEIHETEASFSSQSSSSNSTCSPQSSQDRKVCLDTHSEAEEERLNGELIKANIESEAATDKVSAELFECERLEAEAIEAIRKVSLIEAAHACEVKCRKEAEDALRATIQEQQKLFDGRREVVSELQKTRRMVALLDSRAQEANRRRDEAAAELSLIQASISSL